MRGAINEANISGFFEHLKANLVCRVRPTGTWCARRVQWTKSFACRDPAGTSQAGKTLSVAFPQEFDPHLAQEDAVGRCP